MVKAVIFDLFGVIRPDNLLVAYRQFGGDPEQDAQLIEDTINAANHGLIPNAFSVFAAHFGVSDDDWRKVAYELQGNDQHVLSYARELRRRVKVGLLSNVSRGRLEALLSPSELELFAVAVGSGDIGYAKPEAQAYEIVAERLGVRLAECVMVDDREDYCLGAQGVGMQAILYTSLGQLKRELEPLLVSSR